MLTRGSIDEQLRWIFTLYDINGDGTITRDELNRIVSSIHDLMGKFAPYSSQANATTTDPGRPSTIASPELAGGGLMAENSLTNEEQVDSLFRKFDLNNDGIITLDEFLEACYKVSIRLGSFCGIADVVVVVIIAVVVIVVAVRLSSPTATESITQIHSFSSTLTQY